MVRIVGRFLGALLSLLAGISGTEGAKILFLCPIAGRSETQFFQPLVHELGLRGHVVTFVTGDSSDKSYPNVKVILPTLYSEIADKFSNISKWSRPSDFIFLNNEVFEDLCDKVYLNAEFQQAISEKYDLVLANVYLDLCFQGVLHKVGAPYILVEPWAVPAYMVEGFGTRFPSSFVPNSFLEYTNVMGFPQRVVNFMVNWVMYGREMLIVRPQMEKVYRKYLGEETAGISEIHRNASMLFMNTHFTSTYHRPLTPDVVEIGCIHCRPAKPLPHDLEDFVGKAPHGFVYFSMGSVLKGSSTPESLVRTILKVFSKLQQRVVWKWELETMGKLGGIPKNVLLRKWLPQQDLLGHPNIKLFVSHGGTLSTQQAIYHGVPVLFFPFFFDQTTNANYAVQNGYALTLSLKDLEEEEFRKTLNRLLTEDKFRNKAKEMSSVYHDSVNLSKPLEIAVHWTEFVLRHKGAPQIRSAARDLNIFQIHCLDVIAFIFSCSVLTIFSICKCFCWCVRQVSANFANNRNTGSRIKAKAS